MISVLRDISPGAGPPPQQELGVERETRAVVKTMAPRAMRPQSGLGLVVGGVPRLECPF